MTSPHRPTTMQPTPVTWFTSKSSCDICGKCRSHGNHKARSKARQARYAQVDKKSVDSKN